MLGRYLSLSLGSLALVGCSSSLATAGEGSPVVGPTPSLSVHSQARSASDGEPAKPERAKLDLSSNLVAQSIFDKPVLFLATGEDGRIAVLIDEAGEIVPYRREQSKWQRLDLPPSQRAHVGTLIAGIYFGRDNRPRLMGTRSSPPGIVYLRFKDQAWRPELREIGPLGKEGPSPLFGVLGEADPEVVCRVDDRCLLKSRQGWKEARPSLAPTAVVRAFQGKGYAVTTDGSYRAEDPHFIKVGPLGTWKSQPSGFWVGPGESVAVVEPNEGLLFTLEAAEAAWKSDRPPIDHPSDVAGPNGDRYVTGSDGLIHYDGSRWSRVSGVEGSLERVIVANWGTVVAGRAGVFLINRRAP